MAYSGVYVFGDSLVDAGNALKLAEAYDDYFPFTSLPDGAPTEEKGYHSGNFTNGWTFADLIANKYLAVTTKSVFPFGFNDPLGIHSDPSGNNLNFAYGGAQIRQGDEVVPDMDDQTDAYRDAVDGDADPDALHLFVFGANDVHDLVPKSGAWTDLGDAQEILQRAANEYIEEILQTIEIGARHILVTGVPNIGVQPYYNGSADEAARRAIATEYAELLDSMIQAQLYKLQIPGVEFHFVPWDQLADSVLGTMADLYGDAEIFPPNFSDEVFFDRIHPTAQVHALAAAHMIDMLEGSAGNQLPLTSPDYSANGSIAVKGEVDTITISLAANTSYTLDLLGLSTLGGNVSVLADPMLKIFRPDGTLLGSNDDGGAGLDSSLTFTSGAAGDYSIQLSGVGIMTGSYLFQAAGQASGNNSYSVSHAGAIILEHVGGGLDTVAASVSYALNSGAEVEVLRTSNDKGKGAINLTGNEFGQTIVGNAGANIIEGKAGADTMVGGAGKDVFVLSNAAVTNPGAANIDRITDYGSGDVVDISQILSVAAGTNVVGGGYTRVTTTGLIQVDVDGGGNNWVTLSQINNGGAVTVRFLSGGVATTLSLSRVSATSNVALASAVAAAGLAGQAVSDIMVAPDAGLSAVSAAPLPNSGFVAMGNGNAFSLPGVGDGILHGIDLGQIPDTIHQRWDSASPGLGPLVTDSWSAQMPPLPVPPGDSIAVVNPMAPTVAMPSAELLTLQPQAALGGALAEALAGEPPTIDSLLEQLPGGALADVPTAFSAQPEWFGIKALDVDHLGPIEVLALHPDAAPLA